VKATVIVELKSSVLDPQGKAIQHSLANLGFEGVEDVRVGKVFRITFDDTTPDDLDKRLKEMCEGLLANTVMENYSFTVER